MRKDLVQRSFGQRVRQSRMRAGFSQEQFALKSGLDRSYMGAVERGERNVTLLTIHRIAKALGVPPSALLERGEA